MDIYDWWVSSGRLSAITGESLRVHCDSDCHVTAPRVLHQTLTHTHTKSRITCTIFCLGVNLLVTIKTHWFVASVAVRWSNAWHACCRVPRRAAACVCQSGNISSVQHLHLTDCWCDDVLLSMRIPADVLSSASSCWVPASVDDVTISSGEAMITRWSPDDHQLSRTSNSDCTRLFWILVCTSLIIVFKLSVAAFYSSQNCIKPKYLNWKLFWENSNVVKNLLMISCDISI